MLPVIWLVNGGDLIDSLIDNVLISGGTGNFTYRGNISQSGAIGTAIAITGHSVGTVTFDTGTINATDGDGLQLFNADGTYDFNGAITLNGGDAGH